MAASQAGWYRDPTGVEGLRYFDGSTWTDHVRSTPLPVVAATTTARPATTTPDHSAPTANGSAIAPTGSDDLPVTRPRPDYRRGIDLGLSGSVTLLDMLIHVVLRWILVGVAAMVAVFPIQVLLLAMRAPILGVVVGLVPLAAAFVSLCRPVRTGSAEFSRLLDGRAGSGERVRAMVRDHLVGRRTPVSEVEWKQVSTGAAETSQDLLLIRRKKLEVWVIAMDSGTDLWVGWTAWVRQYPIVMPFTYARQLLNRSMGKGSEFHEAIRQSEARAVLLAVHHSVVDVAGGVGNPVVDGGPAMPGVGPTHTVTSNGSTPASLPALAGGASGWWAG